ncbi:MAG: hypothetical protein ACK47B_11255 [Armatimonadota bacterium]
MAAQPCVRHPDRTTLVRCGRCEKPICIDCMVDSPVGKKCRDCARNRTHVEESNAVQVVRAFTAATALAIPMGWVMHQITLLLLPFVYGYVVAEVGLRAGQRRRTLAMQVSVGVAALIGSVAGFLLRWQGDLELIRALADSPTLLWALGMPLLATGIGVACAVARVRFW